MAIIIDYITRYNPNTHTPPAVLVIKRKYYCDYWHAINWRVVTLAISCLSNGYASYVLCNVMVMHLFLHLHWCALIQRRAAIGTRALTWSMVLHLFRVWGRGHLNGFRVLQRQSKGNTDCKQGLGARSVCRVTACILSYCMCTELYSRTWIVAVCFCGAHSTVKLMNNSYF